MPSTMTTRPLPWDSPAVMKRKCIISGPPRRLVLPDQRLDAVERDRAGGDEASLVEVDELGWSCLIPVEVLDSEALDIGAKNAARFGAAVIVSKGSVYVDLDVVELYVRDIVENHLRQLFRYLHPFSQRAAGF